MKKIRKENEKTLRNETIASKQRIKNIKDEYKKNEESLTNQLQSKLIRLRSAHSTTLSQEKDRLNNEVMMLQKSHDEKIVELTETHANQINQKNETLENKLNTLEMKFEREISKLA